jgi:hypothetical protein
MARFKKSNFSKPQLAIFAIAFALIGYLIFRTFAAPNPNLPGDLNNDNTVNITDMSILLSNYGTSNATADINGDGTVNVLDLSILLSNYGKSISGSSIQFGETRVLSTDDYGNANTLLAQSASLPQSGTLQSLSFYVSQAAGKLRLGLYDDNGPNGGPGTKLAETAEITPIAGWNKADVTSAVNLPSGIYWLAYLPSDNNLHFVKASDSSSSARINVGYVYGALPATFTTTPTSSASHWSFYATVGISGSSSAPTVSLTANPSSVSPGVSSTLSWNSSNATSCSATWTTSKATSGSQSVSPTSTTSYSMSCTGTGGTSSATTTVTVGSGGGGSTYKSFVGVVGPDLQLISSKGVYNDRIDIGRLSKATLDTARAAGESVIPLVAYNPYSDLRPSGTSDHYAPDTTARRITWSQRMMQTVTSIYSTPPEALEVWNEPFLQDFWNQGPNGAQYLDLVHQFSQVAWATPGYSNMKILVSCDSGWGGWCDNLIAADTNKYLNDPRMFPTAHPYCNDRSPDYHSGTTQAQKDYDCDRYKFTYNIWKAHGAADPKVWLTEFGWVSITAGQTCGCSEGPAVSEQTQSDYTVKFYKNAMASGIVAKAYAYMLSPNQTWSYSWLRADNSDKPVISAVKNLVITGN